MEENDLIRTTLSWQKRSQEFVRVPLHPILRLELSLTVLVDVRCQEEGIIGQIRTVWSAFSRWKNQGSSEMQREWSALASVASELTSANDWASLETEGRLLKADHLLRNVHDLAWPGSDDPAVKPLKQGFVEDLSALWATRFRR